MNPLITPQQVVALAFSAESHIRATQISQTDIVVAEQKFLAPVFGAMWSAVRAGAYAEFTQQYLAPALACYVKSQVLPSLAAITSSGVVSRSWEGGKSASEREVVRLARAAADQAHTLRAQAVAWVESHPDDFPDYDPSQNVLNHTRIEGGIVL